MVELAGPFTAYAGKLMADMGADVILVEPLGGAAGRLEEPFAAGVKEQMSLTFTYLNTNKRSLVLDLEAASGQQTFRELASRTAVLLEDMPPGRMASLGLSYKTLAAANPQLVYASISPYGQDGPYVSFAASDLTLLAMGGLLYLGGYADAMPVRAAGNQALLGAGQFAAVGAMIAVLEAERTGRGQRVDVSAQECVVAALETSAQYWDLEKVVRKRTAGGQSNPGSGIMPCLDGHIYMTARFGPSNAYWRRLVDWLIEDGVPGAEQLREERWTNPDWIKTDEAKREFAKIFLPFSMSRTRAELYEAAARHELPFSPINTPAEVLRSEQLRARQYFVPALELKSPTGEPALIAGPPYKLTATPWQLRRPAPRAGEHTEELLAELEQRPGARSQGPESLDRQTTTPGARVHVQGPTGLDRPPASDLRPPTRPLAGIRVADFTWHGAGSFTTRMLADHGAEVIKFESSARMDALRLLPPFKDKVPGMNRSGYFAERNANKRSVALNLKHPAAREVALRLIARSDIVSNNFAPGTMERFHLGYEDLRQLFPNIIYLAMSMQGASGPDRLNSGYGLTISALSGLHHLSGLPDREPAGTGTNYSDHIPAPCHATFAVLAALRHRSRTGEGQYIELSQAETQVSCLGSAMLDYSVNGHIQQRAGNLTWQHAPSGVYPCQGDDRWLAISVGDDVQWSELAEILGVQELASDARFATMADRHRNHAELDRLVAERTASQDAYALMEALQARGVAAGVVQSAADVMDRDPQLQARGHWVALEHPEMGSCRYGAPPFHLSAHQEQRLTRPAPLLGQHTREVCVNILGYSEQEVERMVEEGVLT